MQRLYLVPIEISTINEEIARGPKYFAWRFDPDPPALIQSAWSLMDYGFAPFCLLLAKDISQVDHEALILNSDVYSFPEILDQQIPSQDNLAGFFEDIGIPTDWLTPSNTYLEFLRQMAAMFQFGQRYTGISGGHSLIDDVGGLDVRLKDWSQQTRDWFTATLASFGYPGPAGNPTLRLLMKQAADLWGATPFYIGGFEF